MGKTFFGFGSHKNHSFKLIVKFINDDKLREQDLRIKITDKILPQPARKMELRQYLTKKDYSSSAKI